MTSNGLLAVLYEQNNLTNNPEYAAQLKAMQDELSKMVDGRPHAFGGINHSREVQ